MGFNSNGRQHQAAAEERLNIFALVIYIQDPLCRFLDDLRRELVPDSQPHAHVSVLPPRPLAVRWEEASEQARQKLERWTPFEVGLGDLQIFKVTNVIYLELTHGAAELHRLHKAMDSGALHFDEPFSFCPHVTLAQDIAHDQVNQATELARQRWTEYTGPRSFLADRAVFVQNLIDDKWLDLAEYTLGSVPVR